MQWYYAEGTEKRGAFSEEQIKALVANGIVQPDTRVWCTGMTDWQPASATPLMSGAVSAPPIGYHRCIITGKFFPPEQMIQTQHGWVSSEGKDIYYQSLREGVPVPSAPGTTNARRDGKYLVVPVNGAQLPMRCVKTNTPVSAHEIKTKTLYWCTPWAAISILLSILIYLILYLILRKKVQVDIPLSPAGKSIIRKHVIIATLVTLGGIALGIVGIADTNLIWLILPALLTFLGGLIYGNIKGTALRVRKLKNGEAWLAGASSEFLAELPPR
ncbi:DUF4339 domain-containing protein [Oleiharenicola lentus]|uniref:DUF4339 domain-containing protein n=1 Tax=Oleiharenicola lentus TaxID=2508720 RepID=UPI003F672A14